MVKYIDKGKCKTFYVKLLNNSLKILDTTITVTHFIFYKTHQSHARSQKWFQDSHSDRVNTKTSVRNNIFFLTYNKSAHSINNYMFNCKFSITCNTNRSLFFSGTGYYACTKTRSVHTIMIIIILINPKYLFFNAQLHHHFISIS